MLSAAQPAPRDDQIGQTRRGDGRGDPERGGPRDRRRDHTRFGRAVGPEGRRYGQGGHQGHGSVDRQALTFTSGPPRGVQPRPTLRAMTCRTHRAWRFSPGTTTRRGPSFPPRGFPSRRSASRMTRSAKAGSSSGSATCAVTVGRLDDEISRQRRTAEGPARTSHLLP